MNPIQGMVMTRKRVAGRIPSMLRQAVIGILVVSPSVAPVAEAQEEDRSCFAEDSQSTPTDGGSCLQAAQQGDVDHQNALGFMYEHGIGVTQDVVQAYKWYLIAGSGGNETARKNREMAAENMSPAQIAEAERLAREWVANHGR